MKKSEIQIFVIGILFFILMSGCAAGKKVGGIVQETAKGIIGISTKQIEEARKTASVKTFPYDYKTCSDEVNRALTKIKAYVYAKDAKKKMIAVYVSREDTTPVGIFFREIDAATIQIEVASPSTFAKELIAGKIFAALEKKPDLEKKEGQIDEKKTSESK